ncbi:MAG TPA: redoxin domain-containing protein [Elusimicrobiota bacterium]|nr:redoxin domain-containing protein [Elusimicrobiota bacterium]
MKKKCLISWLCLLAVLSMSRTVEAGDPEIGRPAPAINATDTRGKDVSLEQWRGSYVVLEWTNPDCPFVRKHYNSGNMQSLQREYVRKKVVWLTVCSSAEGKQGFYSAAEWNTNIIPVKNIAASAVLLDPLGETGTLYGAKTTPHLFIIDPKGILIYKGAIDDIASSDPEDIPRAKNHVRNALEEALSGKKVSVSATQPYGCSVKYR